MMMGQIIIMILSVVVLTLALNTFYYFILHSKNVNELKRRKLVSFFFKYKDLDILNHPLPFDSPTDEEIKRGFVTIAPPFWGNQIRIKKSLRILVIGGSNSENHYINSYTPTLEKRIHNLTANDLIHKSSYIIPGGVSSAGPTLFFNKKFDFEKSLSLEDWPNIIILEFSITSNHDNNDAFNLDNLIHIIRQKWEINKLLPPSFLIIDLFSTSFFYDGGPILWGYLDKLRSGVFGPPDSPIFNKSFNVMKLNRNEYDGIGFNRGDNAQPFISMVSRFYQIPMISFTEAMWPSFTRYFSNADSLEGRSAFLVDKFIIPFLMEELKKNNSFPFNQSSIYSQDIRLFPVRFYTKAEAAAIGYFSSWGVNENTLKNIIIENYEWKFLPTLYHEKDNNHICYGSTNSTVDKPVQFKLDLNDKRCNNITTCGLILTYIHSWNESYIGDLTCNIFNANNEFQQIDNSKPLLRHWYKINGNKYKNKVVEGTRAYPHQITKNLTNGNYILRCSKIKRQTDQKNNLLSCIATIELVRIV